MTITAITARRLLNARKVAADAGGAASFARRMSMSRQQANHIIGANPVRAIGDVIARRIEETYGHPLGWLDQDHTTSALPEDAPFVDVHEINLAAATGLALNLPPSVLQVVRIPKDWLRLNATGAYENMALLTYTSDDMEHTIKRDSVLLLDRAQSRIGSSGVYALVVGDAVLVRRAVRATPDSVSLGCDNSLYNSTVVDSETKMLVLGRVVASWASARH